MMKSYVKTESFATFLARDDDDFGVVKMMKVLAGRTKANDIFDVLAEMWWGWKCMGNRGVNLKKQEILNLKSKTEIFSVSIKLVLVQVASMLTRVQDNMTCRTTAQQL